MFSSMVVFFLVGWTGWVVEECSAVCESVEWLASLRAAPAESSECSGCGSSGADSGAVRSVSAGGVSWAVWAAWDSAGARVLRTFSRAAS
jgi:hypothetical protein